MATARLPKMNPVLRRFWATRARYRVLYGGRASSKSHDAAANLIVKMTRCTIKVVCARQFQNRISESVYPLLISKIELLGLKSQFEIQKTTIKHKYTGSSVVFLGIARNIDEIKSMEGIDVLWIEECAQMTEEQWDTIEPTIRKEGSEIWLIFNPALYTDFVYRRFVRRPPRDAVVRHINYDENPFLSRTMLRVIASAKDDNPEAFGHIYGGEPLMDDHRAIIQMKYLVAATDAHLKLDYWASTQENRIGYDVADDGADQNATCEATGNIVTGLDAWDGLEDQLLQSAAKVYHRAVELNAEIVYDSLGVGAGVGPKFAELNEASGRDIHYDAFAAGGVPAWAEDAYMELPHQTITHRQFFSNIKAQAWWLVADRLRLTYEAVVHGRKPDDPTKLISICSDLPKREELFEELTTPRKDFDQAGRVKVESKKDLAKRGVKSPNLADAFIDVFAPIERESGVLDFF